MRALFFEYQDSLVDGVYVMVAKDHMSQISYSDLKRDFNWSFKRLECLAS